MATERTVNDSSRIVPSSSTVPKMALLLICLQLLLLSTTVQGEIQCECNTPDCKLSDQTTCVAKYYCFIEYIYTGSSYKATSRGCIDSRTPINCERFVPQDHTGRKARHWPHSYCCVDSWCNIDKPAQPRVKLNRNKMQSPFQKSKDLLKSPKTTDKSLLVDEESRQNQSRKSKYGRAPPLSPNPAHIAVPVAGAFFVISLIVLVVILVRRKEADDNNNSMVNKYQTVSVSFGSRMKPTGTKENAYEVPPIPLYASVGSKPAYPLCPVVTRAPC